MVSPYGVLELSSEESRLPRARTLHLNVRLADVRLDDDIDPGVVFDSGSGSRSRHPRGARGEKARFENMVLVRPTALVPDLAKHAGDVVRVHRLPVPSRQVGPRCREPGGARHPLRLARRALPHPALAPHPAPREVHPPRRLERPERPVDVGRLVEREDNAARIALQGIGHRGDALRHHRQLRTARARRRSSRSESSTGRRRTRSAIT